MRISVIIPVYNSALFIKQAVESVLNQSLLPEEIILIDDGSTDGSLQIIKGLERSNSLIKAFSQENSGPSVTRNRGVQYANYELICFMDADDLLHPQRLEIASHFSGGYDAVVCDYVRFKGTDDPQFPPLNPEAIISLPDRETTLGVLEEGYGLPRMLIRKNSYLKAGGVDESLVNREDHEFHFRMLTKGMRFKKIDAPLYYYRQHSAPDRLTLQGSKFLYSYKALYKMIEQISVLPDKSLQTKASGILADRLANVALKHALQGGETFREHLRFAQTLHPDPKPYKHPIYNNLSKMAGMGNLELLIGKVKSYLK